MNDFSNYVAIVAGLAGVVGVIATLLENEKINKKKLIVLLTVLGLVILTGAFFASLPTSQVHSPTLPVAKNVDSTARAAPLLPPALQVQAPTLLPSPIITPDLTAPTPSPIATPELSPTVIQTQLSIPCTSCSPGSPAPSTIKLDKIVVDPSQNKLLYYFTLTNMSSSIDNSGFSTIQLQNTTDDSITQAEGAGTNMVTWSLGPTNTVDMLIRFDLTPSSTVPYRLVIIDQHYNRYKDEYFTF